MKAIGAAILLSLAVSGAGLAQEEAAPAPADTGLLTGPATIAPHWSRYEYPESVPEGVPYYIIVRGDTLWDLSARFLGTPFLWPQIWEQNPYITDAHWIYPGDPLLLPELRVISDRAGLPEALPEDDAAARAAAEAARRAAEAAERLIPATEPDAIMCSGYITPGGEDRSLTIIGNEEGRMFTDKEGLHKIAMANRDIVYLSRGAGAGIQPGDRYTIHHAGDDVRHPRTGQLLGTRIDTVGSLRVILVQQDHATAVIEKACFDVRTGDYLLPYRERPIPFLTPDAIGRADRLVPPSGKAQGYVVDMIRPVGAAGAGSFVQVDLGSADGVAPGSVLIAFRMPFPGRDTSRSVLAELAVLTVQERTATAKIMYSRQEILLGDQIEIK